MVQFLLFVLSLFWFVVSIHNRNLLLDVYFQDLRSKVLWRIHSRNSLQKFVGITNCTREVFFYLSPLLNILHFGLSLSRRDVGFQHRDVSTSRRRFDPPLERRDVGSQRRDVGVNHSLERRDVGSQRRDVGCFPLWNVATLALFTAKDTLILLLPLFPSLPEPYCPCRRPHRRPFRNPLPSDAIVFPSDYLTDFATTIHALPVHCPCLTPSTSRLGVLD